MVSVIVLVVIALYTGGIVWMCRCPWHAYAPPVSPVVIPGETLALEAFAHGNSCLAAGKFADAVAAFHQARELEPKHPHVAGRLAEVARRQHATSATPSVNHGHHLT